MEENRFFRFVWRFNAVVIMCAGVMAIVVLSFILFKLYGETFRTRNRVNIVNTEGSSKVHEKWELGHVRQVPGNPYLIAPLTSNQSYSQSYFKKSTQPTRNLLFISTQTDEKKWLFPTNEYLISGYSFLSAARCRKQAHGQDCSATAILYRIIKKDTNNNNRLTEADVKTVALSTPSGGAYTEILDGVQMIMGHTVVNDDTLLLLYQKDNVECSAKISLSSLKILTSAPLPKPGGKL